MSRRIASVLAIGLVAICGSRAIGCNHPSTLDSSKNEARIAQVSQATGTTFWTQVAVSVPAFDTSAPVYDAARKVVVLATAASGAWQTWEWDGAAWSMKCTGAACGLPTPGTDSYTLELAFDRVRNVVVGVGEDLVLGDPSAIGTYEWTGATWSLKCTTGDAGASCGPSAPPVAGGLVFDSDLGRTVNVGGPSGAAAGSPSLDSWDGASWRHEISDAPHATVGGTIGYDSTGKRLVLFGGGGEPSASETVTSFWSPTGGWVDACGALKAPCAILGRVIAFGGGSSDPATGQLVVYGGECKQPECFVPRILSDTWVFDGTSWTSLCGQALSDGGQEEICGPALNSNHGMTFDEARREFILLGNNSSAVTEMWTYRTGGAACAADTDCGGAQVCSTDKVCCDQSCTDVCHSCTTASAPGICTELSHGEGDPDTCSGGKACGANGACQIAGGVACTGDSVCASGHCSDGVCCNTACDGQCDVCTKALGAPNDGTCGNSPSGYVGNPSCGGVACSGTSASCPGSCATNKDCASGFSCVSGKCEGVTCDGDHTVTTSDGTKIDCAPYKCGADQACEKTCANVNDCSAPNVCNSSKVCVAPTASSDSGGCSTSAREDTTRSIPTLLLGILAFALRRRRRRA